MSTELSNVDTDTPAAVDVEPPAVIDTPLYVNPVPSNVTEDNGKDMGREVNTLGCFDRALALNDGDGMGDDLVELIILSSQAK